MVALGAVGQAWVPFATGLVSVACSATALVGAPAAAVQLMSLKTGMLSALADQHRQRTWTHRRPWMPDVVMLCLPTSYTCSKKHHRVFTMHGDFQTSQLCKAGFVECMCVLNMASSGVYSVCQIPLSV